MSRAAIRFTPEAARLIAKLPREVKKLVRQSIDELATKAQAGSELTAELQGYRSLKARRYRIIYRVDDRGTKVEIYFVGHRRDVYETLRSLLLMASQ